MPNDNVPEIVPSDLEGKPLGEHDDKQIVETRTSITGTGDGLSKAMKIGGGVHLPMGSKVMVLVSCFVDSHEYDYTKEAKKSGDLDELVETAVLVAEGALFMDPAPVREIMTAHLERLAEAKRKAEEEAAEAKRKAKEEKGIFQLPDGLQPTGSGAPKGEGTVTEIKTTKPKAASAKKSE